MASLRNSVVRRGLWAFGAQGLSSASNFGLTVAVLAAATQRQFATFSICVTASFVVVQIARAAIGLPVLILCSGREQEGEAAALGAALAAGMLAGAALMIAGLVAGRYLDGARAQLLVLGAATPLLVLQDVARYVAFARGRPSLAAAGDGSWIALQVAAMALLRAMGHASPVALLGVWAGAGAVAGLGTLAVLGTRPALGAAAAWARSHRRLWQKLLAELALNSGSYHVVYFGLAVVAGTAQLGHLKAAQTLYGPVIVLLLGGSNLGVPESMRARDDVARMRRVTVALGSALVAVSLVVGAAVWLVLPWLGPHLFANSWAGARPVLPVLSVFAAAVGASTAAVSGLRAFDANAWIVRGRAASGALQVAVALPAAWLIGANGALLGLAVAEWLYAGFAWAHLTRLQARSLDRCPPAPRRGPGANRSPVEPEEAISLG